MKIIYHSGVTGGAICPVLQFVANVDTVYTGIEVVFVQNGQAMYLAEWGKEGA